MKDKGTTYYDFTNLFSSNSNIKFWTDRTHLSKIGAEVFSDSLVSKNLTGDKLNMKRIPNK